MNGENDPKSKAAAEVPTDGANQSPLPPAITGEQVPALPPGQAIDTTIRTSPPENVPSPWKSFFSRMGAVLSGLVTFVFLVALWDSYRPKVTIVPGPSFDEKEPFATTFIIQNEGSLPIRNVSFDRNWTYADEPSPAINFTAGVAKIAKLNSLEQHAMLDAANGGPVTNTLRSMPDVTLVPMPIAHHSLVMWFDVQYDTIIFGHRTDTLYFIGGWDGDGHFQWLPTGNVDARTEGTDADLLKRAVSFQEKLAHQKPPQPPNPPKSSTMDSAQKPHKP